MKCILTWRQYLITRYSSAEFAVHFFYSFLIVAALFCVARYLCLFCATFNEKRNNGIRNCKSTKALTQ